MRYLFLIILFASCSAKVYGPIELPPTSDFKIQSVFCVGDYITGADTGGTYSIYLPQGYPVPSLDVNTGCFNSDDLVCPDEEFVFQYIVESPNCVGCTDTTKVYFTKDTVFDLIITGNCND